MKTLGILFKFLCFTLIFNPSEAYNRLGEIESYINTQAKVLNSFPLPVIHQAAGYRLPYNHNISLRNEQISIGTSCRKESTQLQYELLSKKKLNINGQPLRYTIFTDLTKNEVLALAKIESPTAKKIKYRF